MRLFLSALLPLLIAVPVFSQAPPSAEPTAFLPPVGTAWLSATTTDAQPQPRGTIGLRPTRAVTMAVRQGDDGTVADIAIEISAPKEGWPSIVLDSRGLGGARAEALDSLLLGLDIHGLEVTGGAGLPGDGGLRPILGLRVPIDALDGWLSADTGHGEGPGAAAGWRLLPFLIVTSGWRRDQGVTTGFTFNLDASGVRAPWPGRERRPDRHDPTGISQWQSPARQLAQALPPGAVAPVTVATHGLGLPGVTATIMTDDVLQLRQGRRSAAEVRRHTRFQRAPIPDSLGRHWQMLLDIRLDAEAAAYGNDWPRRVSAGARLDILPWPGLVLTAAGRIGTAAGLVAPEELPPLPGREDAAYYLRRHGELERAQLAYARPLTPALDLLVEAGHLDSQFGGAGGELRYQPVLSRWSMGAGLHQVWKRALNWNALYRGSGRLTGHGTLGWESADAETRSELRGGRYLAGDWGGGIGLIRQFGHGAWLSADLDITTQTTRAGLSLTVPFGTIGAAVDLTGSIRTAPLSGGGAERLDRIQTLTDLRYSAGYGRLLVDWDRNFRP